MFNKSKHPPKKTNMSENIVTEGTTKNGSNKKDQKCLNYKSIALRYVFEKFIGYIFIC